MERLKGESISEVSQSTEWFGFPEQRSNQPGHFDVLTPVEFLADLQEALATAKQWIWLKTMHLEHGEISQILLGYLRAAHQRGVKIRLHIDHFSTLLPGRWYPPNLVKELIPGQGWELREQRKKDKALFREFGQIAEELTFTNPPRGIVDKVIPMRGRDHRKITIIDGKVAYLGGLNYFDWDFKRPDFMVRIEDPEIVSRLAIEFDCTLQGDHSIDCNEETHLLVDAGKPGQSLILDRAVKLVNQATRVFCTSQFVPDGPFLRALNAAYKRGVKLEVIVSSPAAIPERIVRFFSENNLAYRDLLNQIPPINFHPAWVHAKLLIVEIEGSKRALIGSHNFTKSTVSLGTPEIALESTNPQLIQNLENFYALLKKHLDSYFQ